MTTFVHGLPLPERLSALLASKRWHARNARRLDVLPLAEWHVLDLLDEAGMNGETRALRDAIADGDAALFRLHLGDTPPPPGWLAIDSAVLIAASRGEDGVALDYAGRATPRVVASGHDGSWVEVAPDFDAFVALIELDAP